MEAATASASAASLPSSLPMNGSSCNSNSISKRKREKNKKAAKRKGSKGSADGATTTSPSKGSGEGAASSVGSSASSSASLQGTCDGGTVAFAPLLTASLAACQNTPFAAKAVTILVLFALFLRYLVSIHPYSGMGKPPMFGDYECQRHWMEVTLHLPVRDWYKQTEENDLNYWGLDYPPLSAYFSWLCGHVGALIEAPSMALFSSRGYETASSKLFMRSTVLLGELCIYFPALYMLVKTYYPDRPWFKQMAAFFVMLLQPSLMLIDHGHFQYNAVSLGLTLWAIVFVLRRQDVLGSICFCLALNFKQMSLYFAPTFFFYLLAVNVNRHKKWHSCLMVLKLGAVVVLTFAVCWAPFLHSLEDIQQVLHRLFPVARGLYEDKVANFWCALSPLLKVNRLLSVPAMVKLCAVMSLAGFLPANIQLFFNPSPRRFLLCLFATSMSFFLFSYHVHEKSILLPLLPLTCLLLDYPRFVAWFNVIAAFSMYPLLLRDGVTVPYLATTWLLFYPLSASLADDSETSSNLSFLWNGPTLQKLLPLCHALSGGGVVLLHLLKATVSPPSAYPDLFDLLMACWSFVHFFLAYIAAQCLQWRLKKSKKR
ncbi:Alpha-1,3-glucosyltransferase [Balamuthia mandrillaris]